MSVDNVTLHLSTLSSHELCKFSLTTELKRLYLERDKWHQRFLSNEDSILEIQNLLSCIIEEMRSQDVGIISGYCRIELTELEYQRGRIIRKIDNLDHQIKENEQSLISI